MTPQDYVQLASVFNTTAQALADKATEAERDFQAGGPAITLMCLSIAFGEIADGLVAFGKPE